MRDREGGRVPDEVEITLVTSRWTSPVSTTVTLASAVPDRNGAFAARLDYADLPLGDYTLVLRVGDEILAERGIAVTILAKPAWSMALETSRHAVVSGDSVQVTARASFFEGTPVAGARIRVASNGPRVFLRTDATGTGTTSHTIQMDDDWAQSSVAFVAARPVSPEEGEISAYAEVAVFQAGVIVQSQSTVENGRLRVGGTVHRVAFDRYEAIESRSPWSVDPYGRVVAGDAGACPGRGAPLNSPGGRHRVRLDPQACRPAVRVRRPGDGSRDVRSDDRCPRPVPVVARGAAGPRLRAADQLGRRAGPDHHRPGLGRRRRHRGGRGLGAHRRPRAERGLGHRQSHPPLVRGRCRGR